uniref:NR LBD domain-containing protein n=1 Tax=Caenorhabditis tropicalis TaxID=1561998 RepID=A0A1I7U4T9_9PELO
MLSDKNPKKTVVDLHRLLGEASKILNLGPATPLFCEGSQLKKLSLGVKNPFYLEKLKEAKMMTKAEIVANWEFYVRKVANWLTHFDEYKKLGIGMQMKLLQTIWHVWSRLEKLSTTAKYRRCAESYKKSEIVVQSGVLVNISNVDFDSKWLSDHPPETVRNFMIHASCDQFDVTDALCELELSEVELTYMLAQLCFSYAGKRLQGEYLDVCEKFLEILSDDLHDFYVNEMNMPRYFGRMAKMMQINNAIQKCAKTPNMSTEIESSPRIYEKTKKRKGSKSASSIQKDASNLKMRQ